MTPGTDVRTTTTTREMQEKDSNLHLRWLGSLQLVEGALSQTLAPET